VQKGYGSGGKIFSASAGIENRKLQNQIRSGQKSHAGPAKFVRSGWGPSLDKVAAHDRHQEVGAGSFPGLLQVVEMAVVKRIVFSNQSCYNHSYVSSFPREHGPQL